MIVIHPKWPSIPFNASHTIADDWVSPDFGLWTNSTTDNEQVESSRVDNKDPLDLRRLSLFFKRQPPPPSLSRGSKLIETDWDIGELIFMMMRKESVGLFSS
jgi:hypothetical protein